MRRLHPLIALVVVLAAPSSYAALDTFCAVVGMDDEAEYFPASSAFQVYLDDELALETQVLRPGDEPVPIEVPLGAARSLRLVITDGGDSIRNDRGDWADARLVDSATGETVFLSDRPWTTRGEWIRANLDRTVTGNPLTLCGVVYCRGLGGFALMDYEWSGWDSWLDERRVDARRRATEGLEALGGTLTLDLPDGVAVAVDGEETHSGQGATQLSVADAASLTLTLSRYDAPSLRQSCLSGAMLTSPRGRVPLLALSPSRIENPLVGSADENAPILAGRPYCAGHGVGREARFHFTAPAAEVADLLVSPASEGGLRFRATLGVAPSSGTPGSLEIVLTEDGVARYRSGILSSADEPAEIDVPIQGSGTVSVRVGSLGDGNLGDSAVIADARIEGGETDLWLHELEPWIAASGWGEVGLGFGADGRVLAIGDPPTRYARGIGLAAEGRIEWRDLLKVAERSRRARALVAEAEGLQPAQVDGRTEREAAIATKRRFLREAVELDPRCAEGHLALAELELDRRFMRRAMDAARRVIDRGGADAAQIRRASRILDECYTHQYLPPSQPNAKRILGATRLDSISGLTPVLCRTPPGGEPPVAVGEAPLLPPDDAERLVVLSRGLEVRVSLIDAEGSEVACAGPAVDPWVSLDAIDSALTVRVEHDFARDRFAEDLEVLVAAVTGVQPTLDLHYDLVGDASVLATVESVAGCVVALPTTALRPEVTGGTAVLCQPAATYGSDLAAYTATQPCLLIPAEGQTARLTYLWPDGGCCLPYPMGHFDGGGDKLWFHSVRQENTQVASIRVTLSQPEGAGVVVEAQPEEYDTETLTWELGPQGFVRYVHEYGPATTGYLHRQIKNMTLHIPMTRCFDGYLPEFTDDMRLLYDRLERLVGGYASEHELYVLVPGPRQLPGYGGATWGGDEVAESWVPAAGHIGEYPLRYRWNAMGIHSHELHWMFLAGVPGELPEWLRDGLSMYTEIEGNEAMGHIGWDDWPRRSYFASRAADYFARYTEPNTGYAWWTNDEKRSLPPEEAENARGTLVQVCVDLEARYGADFWGDFCRAARERRAAIGAIEDNQGKTAWAIALMAEVSGDPAVRSYFADRGWPVEALQEAE